MKTKQNKELQKLRPLIVKTLKAYGIRKAGLFGSYVRNENKKRSDLDIIIQPKKGMGFKFFGLQLELEKMVGRKVDLVSYKSLHPLLKERILREEVRLL